MGTEPRRAPISATPRARSHASGRYVIFDAIASGGMASVHLARLRGGAGFGKTVAVKRLHASAAHDTALTDALIAEARHVARIRHPNVVSVIDVIDDAGDVGIVMELVHGVALSALMREARLAGKRVPPAVAVGIIAGVLRGLHAAHEARDEQGAPLGLVHRDVSPQNVLVGADGVARVVDFGIAKAASLGDATRGRELKGKPGYMAPEQLRGEPVDARADVYAATVMLWELVTGQRLFAGDSDFAVVDKVLHRPVDAPRRIVPDLPGDLSDVILRGLSRDREQRFGSALELAEALEATKPAATPSQIARTVTSLCGQQLDELEARVAEAESADALPEPAQRSSWRRPAVAAALIAAVGVGLWSFTSTSRQAAAPPASAPPVHDRLPRPEPAEPLVSLRPPAPPAPTGPRSAQPAATAAGRPRRAPRPAPQPVAAPAPEASVGPAPPDCDPPYVVDKSGFHHMKPECLAAR